MSDPRVEEIFLAALEMPAEERLSYLEKACGGDAELRSELDSLLGAEDDASVLFRSPSAKVPPPLPESIGSYVISKRLGSGGMGDVYLGKDPNLNRWVAIKVIPDELISDPEMALRFEREAQILATINHPHVATIYSLERMEDGHRFLTMEWVDGVTLAERLSEGPLSHEEALSICRQVAGALVAAHDLSVIHRDLKPLNVMVTPSGQVKVLDFGLAKRESAAVHESEMLETRPGMVMGTLGYMSPEQLRGEKVDFATDVWAFGCLLYECLAGVPAFPGNSMPERIAATMGTDPEWGLLPISLGPRIPRLLRQCLRKDPAERLSDILLVREEIERVLAPSREGLKSTRQLEVLESDASNLPEQFSRFIGRETELNQLTALAEEERLVTITGTGGAGKTRLALAAAKRVFRQFPDGVWLLELASLTNVRSVPQLLLSLLGIPAAGAADPLEVLQKILADRDLLLVFDNCEHLRDETAVLVGALLRGSASVRIWTTSREPLGISGERIFVLSPMELPEPDDLNSWQDSESARLFLDRARGLDQTFQPTDANREHIVKICRELDGLPLAIELAVARLRVLSVEEVAERLDQRFRLLRDRNPEGVPHHRALSELIDWSYSLLTSAEQTLFRRLSVFPSDWDLVAAEEIAADDAEDIGGTQVGDCAIVKWEILDGLARLVDKSLLEAHAGQRSKGKVRYRMLVSIREFARERGQTSGSTSLLGLEKTTQRHLTYYAGLAEREASAMNSPQQSAVLSTLDLERDNYQAAIEASLDTEDAQSGIGLCLSLGRYWFLRGHWAEGHSFCSRMLEHPELQKNELPSGLQGLRAHLLNLLGNLELVQSRYAEAARTFESARELHEASGDAIAEARSLQNLGLAARQMGDVQKARNCAERCLALYESLGAEREIAQGLNNLGNLDERAGEFVAALQHHQKALSIRRKLGEPAEIGESLANVGNAFKQVGNSESAGDHYRESLKVMDELGDPAGIAIANQNLGDLCLDETRYDDAQEHFEKSLAIKEQLGNRSGAAITLHSFGRLNLSLGQVSVAMDYHVRSLEIRRQLEQPVAVGESLHGLALLHQVVGDEEKAFLAVQLALACLERAESGAGEIREGVLETSLQLRALVGEARASEIEREVAQHSSDDLMEKVIR